MPFNSSKEFTFIIDELFNNNSVEIVPAIKSFIEIIKYKLNKKDELDKNIYIYQTFLVGLHTIIKKKLYNEINILENDILWKYHKYWRHNILTFISVIIFGFKSSNKIEKNQKMNIISLNIIKDKLKINYNILNNDFIEKKITNIYNILLHNNNIMTLYNNKSIKFSLLFPDIYCTYLLKFVNNEKKNILNKINFSTTSIYNLIKIINRILLNDDTTIIQFNNINNYLFLNKEIENFYQREDDITILDFINSIKLFKKFIYRSIFYENKINIILSNVELNKINDELYLIIHYEQYTNYIKNIEYDNIANLSTDDEK